MVKVFGPTVAQFFQYQKQHFKVVVLLVAHGVDHSAHIGVVLDALYCRAQVLCDINRGAVAPQHEFFIEALVGEVAPNRAVILPEKHFFFKAFLDDVLAQ